MLRKLSEMKEWQVEMLAEKEAEGTLPTDEKAPVEAEDVVEEKPAVEAPIEKAKPTAKKAPTKQGAKKTTKKAIEKMDVE